MPSERADSESAPLETPSTDAPSTRRSRPPSIQFRCPHCDRVRALRAETFRSEAESRRCGGCGLVLAGPVEGDETAPVEACWICGNREFFVQRDFNRQLGFTIVAAMALIVLLIMLLFGHRVGIVVLLGVALLDLVVYHVLPDVTVCYLCNTLYRGFPRSEAHGGFYLGLEEKYKRLRKEWAEKLASSVRKDSTHGRG